MSRKRRTVCGICGTVDSRYVCPGCNILYCTLACYKPHKETCKGIVFKTNDDEGVASTVEEDNLQAKTESLTNNEKPLRPLTSLKWPYIPEEPSYRDISTVNQPKPLQLKHYESIASSHNIRQLFENDAQLKLLLRKIDTLRGEEREEALEYLVGVGHPQGSTQARPPQILLDTANQDVLPAFKALVQAIQSAIEEPSSQPKGLTWEQ